MKSKMGNKELIELLSNSLVKETVLSISILLDTRKEKGMYKRMNWLNDLGSEYSNVLSLLFKSFGSGEETTKSFAIRLLKLYENNVFA